MKNEVLHIVNNCFELQAVEADMMLMLEQKINELILHNFNKLIYLLYRADINETKLNALLAEHKKENAGKIIAALFVQRQIEKLHSREINKQKKTPFCDEEKW